MKASTPSLILFFTAAALAIFFRAMGFFSLVLYTKSIIIPSLFIYYFVLSNYKVSFTKAFIFLLCFMRDVFVILNIKESALGAFLCILLVYLLLLKFSLKDFRYLKFNYRDSGSIIILTLVIGTICYSVLNLKLEKLELSFSLYVFFGIVLSFLSIVSITNYIKIGSYAFFNLMLMCVCFIITDVFFVIYNFYMKIYAFTLISIITQVLSYFFMVSYLIEKEKIQEIEVNG
jgi:hypothetical protein